MRCALVGKGGGLSFSNDPQKASHKWKDGGEGEVRRGRKVAGNRNPRFCHSTKKIKTQRRRWTAHKKAHKTAAPASPTCRRGEGRPHMIPDPPNPKHPQEEDSALRDATYLYSIPRRK